MEYTRDKRGTNAGYTRRTRGVHTAAADVRDGVVSTMGRSGGAVRCAAAVGGLGGIGLSGIGLVGSGLVGSGLVVRCGSCGRRASCRM
jgi:hypothetical protein